MFVAVSALHVALFTQQGGCLQMPNYASALKDYRCSNCGDEYQSLYAYLHPVLGTVCDDCLNIPVTESEWA